MADSVSRVGELAQPGRGGKLRRDSTSDVLVRRASGLGLVSSDTGGAPHRDGSGRPYRGRHRRCRRRAPVARLLPRFRNRHRDLQPRRQADPADDSALHARRLHPRGGRNPSTSRPLVSSARRLAPGRYRDRRGSRLRLFHELHRRQRRDHPRDGRPSLPHAPSGELRSKARNGPAHLCRLARAALPALARGDPLRARRRGRDPADSSSQASLPPCSRSCSSRF